MLRIDTRPKEDGDVSPPEISLVGDGFPEPRRRADHAVRALRLWHEYGCRTRLPDDGGDDDATAAPRTVWRRDTRTQQSTLFAAVRREVSTLI